MTKGQRIALQADWWPATCRSQGWKTSDRDLRLRVCAWAVSLENPTQLQLLEAIQSDRQPARWLESTNDLDNKDDIDRVKFCLALLADQVIEQNGPIQRLLYKIKHTADAAYIVGVLRSPRFKKTSLADMETMGKKDLTDLLRTLTARMAKKLKPECPF